MKIESIKYNPDHFVSRYNKKLKYLIPILIIILLIIQLFVPDTKWKTEILNWYFYVISGVVIFTFYSILIFPHKDFEGQFIELDGENLRVVEMSTLPLFLVKKTDLMVSGEIDLNEVKTIRKAHQSHESNRIVGIYIEMKDDYVFSTIQVPGESRRQTGMRITHYGYEIQEFNTMIAAIEEKFESLN